MKTVNRICQVLAIVFGLGALVLFFMQFATIVSGGNEVNLVGAQLAFGGKIKDFQIVIRFAEKAPEQCEKFIAVANKQLKKAKVKIVF